jgi:hypothetical protein
VNLIDQAEDLMLHQFKDSLILIGLIRSLITPFEEVAQNIQRLQNGRYIDEAEGRRLDILGLIVGQPRRDMNDEDYRAWIQVGIKLNIGSGTPEDVLGILGILLGHKKPILLQEHVPDGVLFIFSRQEKVPPTVIFGIVRCAVANVIKCSFAEADACGAFRLNMTSFSQSKFADFFKEDKHE